MGGSGGGNQSVTQEFKPPAWTQPGWEQYLGAAGVLSQKPYEESGLPQIAPWNDYQNTAAQLAYDMTTYGTPMGNAANSAFYNVASGNMANPYADPMASLANQENPYFGDQFTEKTIANNAQNMADAFASGTAAQSDSSAAMAGAFGGSGHQQQQAANAAALAKQVGQMADSTRAQQQQTSMGAWNQGIQNKMAALQGAGGLYNADVQNMLSGAQGGLAGNADYRQSLQGMMGAGNSMNNYVQQLLGQYNNEWNTQSNYDQLMNELYGTALSRASGSYGGSATTQPGQSMLGGLLGLGAGAAGLYSLFK